MLDPPENLKPTSRRLPLILGGCSAVFVCVAVSILAVVGVLIYSGVLDDSDQKFAVLPITNTLAFTTTVKSVRATIKMTMNGKLGSRKLPVSATTENTYFYNKQKPESRLLVISGNISKTLSSGYVSSDSYEVQSYAIGTDYYTITIGDRSGCEKQSLSGGSGSISYLRLISPMLMMQSAYGLTFDKRIPTYTYLGEEELNGIKVNHYSLDPAELLPESTPSTIGNTHGSIDQIEIWINPADSSLLKMSTQGSVQSDKYVDDQSFEGSVTLEHEVVTSDKYEPIVLPAKCAIAR